MPEEHMGSDGSVWIQTDIITVMASGEAPMMQFWFTPDGNGTIAKFSAGYITLIEFQDSNGDSAYQRNEVLNFAPLAAYEWTVQTGSVSDNGVVSEVWLKYTKGGIRSGGMASDMPVLSMSGSNAVHRFEDVTIQIWAHLYLDDYQGNVTDDKGVQASYLVAGGYELKMDIEIGNFPFTSDSTSAALQLMLRENEAHHSHMRYRFETQEHARHMNMTSDMNWTSQYQDMRFERQNNTHVQEIEFAQYDGDTSFGFFRWVDKAIVTLPGGATTAVNVTASYLPMGMGLALTFAYPNFDNGTLLHDPSIGLYPSALSLFEQPLPTTLIIGVVIIAVIALAIVVKKR